MIKPINATQLSSMKPRGGLHRISDLVPRLIRQYELQAELMKRCNPPVTQPAPALADPMMSTGAIQSTVMAPAMEATPAAQQATFGWFE